MDPKEFLIRGLIEEEIVFDQVNIRRIANLPNSCRILTSIPNILSIGLFLLKLKISLPLELAMYT